VSGGETHSVRRHLDVGAERYDAEIRRFIPHYDEMIATGVEVLAALAPAAEHVLDLGGGTGALSCAVLDGLRCFWRRELCAVTCAVRAN
jgi:hypothetical protein